MDAVKFIPALRAPYRSKDEPGMIREEPCAKGQRFRGGMSGKLCTIF